MMMSSIVTEKTLQSGIDGTFNHKKHHTVG